MASKRKIFIIDPPFQLKISFYICLILVLSSVIYPITIHELITLIVNKIAVFAPDTAQILSDKWQQLLIVMALWQIGITGLVFIICIFISHKIAGPMYKLKKYLTDIRDGNSNGKLTFRKGDYFKDVADEVNKTLDTIQENYKKDFMYLSEVNSYLNNLSFVVPSDKKVVLQEIQEKLAEIQNRFK